MVTTGIYYKLKYRKLNSPFIAVLNFTVRVGSSSTSLYFIFSIGTKNK